MICCIQAFDCEKTVEAAMESVLSQSFGDWLCFVLSNGNCNTVQTPNNSLDVINNFAARDRRFIVVNKECNDLQMYFRMLYHFANCFPDSYLCTLDADDEYEPDFFESGMTMAKTHGLDIVACGTQIIQKREAGDSEGVLLTRRQVEEPLIVREDAFSERFPVYKPFFNEMWGKLFRAKLLIQPDYERYIQRKIDGCFLGDTVFTLDTLSKSRAIGVLPGTCHRFYQYQQRNASNATLQANAVLAQKQEKWWKEKRYSVYVTYQMMLSFLQAHGRVEGALYEYTQAVLFGWFGDYYARTLLPIQDEKTFAKLTSRLVFHPKFDELMRYRGSGAYRNLRDYRQRLDFCRRLRYTLLAQKMVRNRKLWRRDNLPCTRSAARELDRAADKLEKTILALQALQEETAT